MIYNFNSGPAALPGQVLNEATKSILNYNKTGLSILELPHRGPEFAAILKEARKRVLDLLGLNADFEVLWLQGGGRMQFSMVPMNFLGDGETAGYIDSGRWAADAIASADFYGKTRVIASAQKDQYRYIPEWDKIPGDLAYLHITTNNTIYGTQFFEFPEIDVPLVADMSSELFSRKLDYRKFDLIYAVAQKNIGPAGVTLVVAKKEFLEKQKRPLPGILSYKTIAAADSIYNTPPVFAIYCSLLNLRWIAEKGIATLEKRNKAKAKMLYNAIDRSAFFSGIAAPTSRSLMNVCFHAKRPELEKPFLDFAASRNITGIQGHRSIGGFRAALYNAVEPDAVAHLVAVMEEFETSYGKQNDFLSK